jgi:CBS domain-containing protein
MSDLTPTDSDRPFAVVTGASSGIGYELAAQFAQNGFDLLITAEVTAGELAEGKPVTIGADDDAQEILRTMSQHKVRRLPVIDGHQLVGIVAVADVARALPDRPVGDLIDALSS